jgi:hypothetical protein
MKNIFIEKFNRLIVRDFLMVKIWPYFHKSIWVAIFVYFSKKLSQKHIFECFRDDIIFMDFVGFPFRNPKF